jgi:hypothetical protein
LPRLRVKRTTRYQSDGQPALVKSPLAGLGNGGINLDGGKRRASGADLRGTNEHVAEPTHRINDASGIARPCQCREQARKAFSGEYLP